MLILMSNGFSILFLLILLCSRVETLATFRMGKINYRLLPIKAHYFFFMAGNGPILPFLPVFGKHLGVSEVVVGGINSTIPLLFLALKPFFGYLIDYFQEKRKFIFMTVIFLMGIFFFSMGFIPDGKETIIMEVDSLKLCNESVESLVAVRCGNLSVPPTEVVSCPSLLRDGNLSCQLTFTRLKSDFYSGFSFWAFAILMSLGTIGYNISNSISDAVCFSILGEGEEMLYGKQRMWGTIGFGVFALIGGYFMSLSERRGSSGMEDFYPALCICGFCVIIDLVCCYKLQLPPLPRSENIVRDIWTLVKQPHIAIFLLFAVFVGICDASIIFYLLWYLEDLAKETVEEENLRLLEGLTVAAETLVGEVVSFFLSGKVLSRLGYGHCLSLCFSLYALRLGLIALIPSPWWILPVEVVMQGPTYALCYTTIVAYASAISPPGTSATVQGIVAGMDDGFGFAVGSMVWSVVYRYYGGKVMFASVSVMALTCCIAHFLLYTFLFSPRCRGEMEKEEAAAEDPEAAVPLKPSSPPVKLN